MKPRFIVKQKITAFANKYAIYQANQDGTEAQMIGFAQQKRLAFKEKVTFYNDDSKSKTVFTLRAEKVMDIHGRFLVEDTNGNLIGGFRKDFAASLTNSTWLLFGADGQEIIRAQESSATLAAMRRFLGYLPVVGDLADIVLLFFKYHFSYFDMASGQNGGKYIKTTLLFDHYMLEMTDELYGKIDWRILAAHGVALDALQSR